MLEILNFFPSQIASVIKNNNLNSLEEIRVRVNKPIILKSSSNELILNYIPNQEEILQILQRLCDNSIYSYQNQICNGYITVRGGHRVRDNRRCYFRGTEFLKIYLIYIV